MIEEFDFDRVANRLEEVCKKRHAHDFYIKLNEMGVLGALERKVASLPHFEPKELLTLDLDLAGMQQIVLQFYGELDLELKNRIEKTLSDPFFEHKFSEPNGNGINEGSRVGFEWKNNFAQNGEIVLNPSNNLIGIITVAHEFAHLLEERIQKRIKNKEDCLGEIASMFIEKVFAEYMLKKSMIEKKDYRILKEHDLNCFSNNVRVLVEENEILSGLEVPISGVQLRELHKKYAFSDRKGVLMRRVQQMTGIGMPKNVQPESGQKRFRYVAGEVVSGALFEDFKKNPKETLGRFENFLSSNAEMEEAEAYQTLLGENYFQKLSTSFQNLNVEQEKSK